jgi:hypothetical protein
MTTTTAAGRLTAAGLPSLDAHARCRAPLRTRVIARERTVAAGPHATRCIEDRRAVLHRVQGMRCGIGRRCARRVGGAVVYAVADERLPRESDSETRPVTGLPFELAPRPRAARRADLAPVAA